MQTELNFHRQDCVLACMIMVVNLHVACQQGISWTAEQFIDHLPLQTLVSEEIVSVVFVSLCNSKLGHLVSILKQ